MENIWTSNSNFFILSLMVISFMILSISHNLILGLLLVLIGLFCIFMSLYIPKGKRKKRL
jgi:hypothetical protein